MPWTRSFSRLRLPNRLQQEHKKPSARLSDSSPSSALALRIRLGQLSSSVDDLRFTPMPLFVMFDRRRRHDLLAPTPDTTSHRLHLHRLGCDRLCSLGDPQSRAEYSRCMNTIPLRSTNVVYFLQLRDNHLFGYTRLTKSDAASRQWTIRRNPSS